MCFRFGSCFGSGSGQDYGWSTPKTTHRGGGRSRSHWGSLADHGYYSGADHKPAYHPPDATDNGGVQKDHADDATAAGGKGGYAAYPQEKADDTLKRPAAWNGNGKVGDDDLASYAYAVGRLDDAAAAGHRESAAPADYHHHYPATTTTTTLARYYY